MLKLYYGRENVDKDHFMFGEIKKTLSSLSKDGGPKRIILLVPDQYTLQAERNAFACLGFKGLMDLEVLSQNRLAMKVFTETGGSTRVHIDKHGRHMLLSKIVSEENENLKVFRNLGRSHSFLDMTNNLISEMKQYNTDLAGLSSIIEELKEGSLLHRKLLDIYRIYEKYEEQIKDRYIDTEDYINLFVSKIGQSSLVRDTEFWMTGFDYLTPKSIKVIEELIKYSKGVHVVFTSDVNSKDRELFYLTQSMLKKLQRASGENVSSIYALKEPVMLKSTALAHLEQHLFAYPYKAYEEETDAITFCRGANFYAEVETAAAYICRLVREKGLRFRDIAVICNDMEERGEIIKRVFEEYEISFFLDKKRKILHNPVIIFISALLDVITEGWLFEDVFRLVKTGFSPLEQGDYEALENYVIRYKIRGNRWRKGFRYGKKEFEEDELEYLNQLRESLVNFIVDLEKKFKEAKTVKEKTMILYDFFENRVELPKQIELFTEKLNKEDEYEVALEMTQIWKSVLGLFDQLIELIGEQEISGEDYSSILKTGFESVELGLIPSTIDQVVVGTMQRTRVGRIKALVVIGVNDGVLPAAPSGDDLLSQDERTFLLKRSIEICKDDDLRIMEERLGIYKNLSKPEEYLWIGFSSSDLEGKEIRPSIIFDKLRKLFPNVPVQKDIRNEEDPMALIERPKSTLIHMTEALRKAASGEDILDDPWKVAYNWFFARGDQRLAMISDGMAFTNKVENLEADLVKKLFQKEWSEDLVLSPSRLERFSRCPFAHLVLYGLAPEERRIFEVASREVGDVYHECLMRLSDNLTINGIEITDEKSPWMNITRDQCFERVGVLMDQIAGEYKEGMLLSGQEERYRTERMKEVCAKAAWALVEHIQQGRIREIYFEEAFGSGRKKAFPPVQINVGNKTLTIEGKIDRIDVLPGGYVKIIDYKSGAERFDVNEAKAGWRLQLMLYLKAAMEGLRTKDESLKPAGVFYFEIADPLVDATNLDVDIFKEKIESEIRKAFKLDGILMDDPDVIEGIAGDFSGFSEILPLRKNKDGRVSATSENKLLKEEEFQALRSAVDQTITELCTDLSSGVIAIHPKKTKYQTACDYCQYKSICNFELSFDGCSYDVVK
ncbi:MAG: PD-(D/E)XK nuclease family protein [Anaerovoracaceae bacterium]|jgi:ATP-dependent helicase/nuclease subunit B